MKTRSNEPLLWLMFSTGGVVAAMLLPVLVFLFGVAFPLGWLSPPSDDRMLTLVGHPLVRLGIFVCCLLAWIHAAHRLRYTLYDGLQIKHLNEAINTLCYGGAIAAAAWAAYVLWSL